MGQRMSTAAFMAGPPAVVQIFYSRAPDDYHRFTSMELDGLLIYHRDLKSAFDMLDAAISDIVSIETGKKVNYELDTSFEDFKRRLEEHFKASAPSRLVLSAHPIH